MVHCLVECFCIQLKLNVHITNVLYGVLFNCKITKTDVVLCENVEVKVALHQGSVLIAAVMLCLQ